jgi:Eukaryotic DNA topoisomerase I, catalytic core
MYLIDKYALRAGNEKGEDEADTVGCCSLRLEHVTLDKSGLVILDFLGKDSIRYYKEIDDIDPQVFKNLRLFKAEKKDTDMLFDRVTVCLFLLRGVLDSCIDQYLLDVDHEQPFEIVHERSHCQSLPYLQRFYYLRKGAAQLRFQTGHYPAGEGQCV